MSCNMDAKIKSGRIKIKKLEDKAVDEEITAKFKSVHALAIFRLWLMQVHFYPLLLLVW